jgi:peptide/nickel transport system permease protein
MQERSEVAAPVASQPKFAVDLRARVPRRRYFLRQPTAIVGAILVLGIIVCAAFAPVLAPYRYSAGSLSVALEGPSRAHLLGTDWVGRDVLSRVIYGARSAVLIGFGATTAALILAVLIGVGGGYYRTVDLGLQRLLDVWLSMPALVLILTVLSVFGSGLLQIVLCIGVVLAAGASRIIRSAALAVSRSEYVAAAKAAGATDYRVLWRHILPNVLPTIIVVSTAQVGSAILIEATLGFLGYGVPPPVPTWGQMLSLQGMTYFTTRPLLAIWPGVAIMMAVYGFNMLGDGLRDRLDPKMRGRA